MRFDLVDLRLFLAIAEAGSITGGAERAGLALASASARIRGLEERLGVRFLERRRRGIALTQAGHALLHHAQALEGRIAQMTGELSSYAKGFRARVRLFSNTAAAAELLPDIIADFLARHATIDVDLEERPSHAVIEAVAGGAADLGVAIARDDLDHLQQRPFRIDRLVVLAPRGWAGLERQRAIAFDAIADAPFVGLSPGNPLQEHIVRQAARRGHHLAFRVRVATLDAVCRLVAQGIGIAIVPEVAARRAGAGSRRLLLTDAWARRQLSLWARDFSALPLQAQLLADALAPDQCSSHPGA